MTKRKAIILLIKDISIGLAISIAILMLGKNHITEVYNEYILIKYGVVTNGVVIKVDEDEGDGDENQSGFYYSYQYTFKLPSGKTYKSYEKGAGHLPIRFSNLEPPFIIKIIYLSDNPNISRDNESVWNSTSDLFLRRGIGVLIIFIISIAFACFSIYRAIISYNINNI